MTRTPCECPLAGWCERHGMEKRRRQHALCQSNLRYWHLWERGQGGATTQHAEKVERRQASERKSRSRRYECVHRSTDPVREVLCQECKSRTVLRPVYACEMHGECVRLPYKLADSAQPVRDCRGCTDRVEPEV